MSTTSTEVKTLDPAKDDKKSDAKTSTALAPAQPQRMVVHDEGPLAYLFDTAKFDHMYRIAQILARASLIPEHLKAKPRTDITDPKLRWETEQLQTTANCLLVVNQSVRWGFDPFAVAPETYVVKGKLGFQGKLVAAVINARAGLKEPLNYTFTGAGLDREVTVHGWCSGEAQERTITMTVRQGKTDNDMWTKDPDQKLCYSGATKWARRHRPEIMLGVLTDDDLERMAMQPDAPLNIDQIAASLGQGEQEAEHKPVETTTGSQASTSSETKVDEKEADKPAESAVGKSDAPSSTGGESEPVKEEEPAKKTEDPIAEIALKFGKCKTLKQVDDLYNSLCGPDSSLEWSPEQAKSIEQYRDHARERIRNGAKGAQENMLPQ